MSERVNVIPPSPNSMCVRVLVAAAGLSVEEVNVFMKTREPAYLEKCPGHVAPSYEATDLPKGLIWESCAIMAYLCNRHGLESFYPAEPGKRAHIDSANAFTISSFYPMLARATYPVLGFPLYPGETQTSSASDEIKAEARAASEAATLEMLAIYKSFFIGEGGFIGGDKPSIADLRFASSLEFLSALSCEKPAWLGEYITRMEEARGDAYKGPAGELRGTVQYLLSQAAS